MTLEAERSSGLYSPSSRRPIADGFRATARTATRWCVAHDVHPDTISIASIAASALAGACLILSGRFAWLLLAAPLFCYMRLWFNMLDGMVALASGKASQRGEVFNELPDRVSDVFIFVALGHSGLCNVELGYLAALFSLGTAYVGTLGQAVGARREFGGVMAKPMRMVLLNVGAWIAFALIDPSNPTGRLAGGLTVLDWTCLAIIVGCVQTIAMRLRSTFRILRENSSSQYVVPAFGAAETPAVLAESAPARLPPSEHNFRGADDAQLFYRAWLPEVPTTRALILFHRGHEHSGRWQETVERLGVVEDGIAVFAWDQRGHGRSDGERGSAKNLATVIADAEAFAKHLVAKHGIKLEDTIVVAHSVGAVVATAWVHDYAPPVRGLVLAAPAFRVKLYVPFALAALRVKQALFGGGYVKSYVKAKMLTHDSAEARAYTNDPLIFRQIAVNILLDLFDTSKRLLADAGAITTPTLILTAGKDWVVRKSDQWKFLDRISSAMKQIEVFPGLGHAIFHETARAAVFDRTRRFVDECFARPARADRAALLDADLGGFTRAEFDRLRCPSDRFGQRAKWSLVRRSLAVGALLSEGMRIGNESGYDSGLMLDYVYEDRARGVTPLGRLIDRIYLNSAGWRGIRVRRRNLARMLATLLDEFVQRDENAIHILDIASGPGRYVLDAIAARRGSSASRITATLRDDRRCNLDAAGELARTLQLGDAVKFELADAFDRESLANVSPKPAIAIVSGLYELFSENRLVRRSLAGLADALEPGGYLIYTCQPWHPQLEFIARALRNREREPWIMRRRTQAEMDELVRRAGFEKVDQAIDRWGIFTVSLARRVATDTHA